MQKDLYNAAIWYLQNYTNNISELEEEIKSARYVRNWALGKGSIEEIERSFAAVEILWAAYCLINDEDYVTDFSPYSLKLIRKYSRQGPKMFRCRKCGQVFPESAFGYNKLTGRRSHYCIRCVKDIERIQAQYSHGAKGYIDTKGAIVCSAA